MEKTLYFIRHAQSYPTRNLDYQKWPLSTLGKRQAVKLSELLVPIGIQRIYSSPFLRCLQTIAPFSKEAGLDILVRDDLRERLVAKTIVPGFYEIWRKSWEDFNFALPGCESSLDAQKRFVQTIEEIMKESSDTITGISTHGNVIGLFLKSFDSSVNREEVEKIRNPDVLRITIRGDELNWDREFYLSALERFATDQRETPVD